MSLIVPNGLSRLEIKLKLLITLLLNMKFGRYYFWENADFFYCKLIILLILSSLY